ncbi:MAG: hypothetical protein V1827_06175 [Candidatus Micrarchaeota archaeon]
MGWVKFISLSLFFMLSLGFAAVIESGDAGEQFVNDTSEAKCKEQNVQAVYQCLGNVVRVVSSVPGEGSTFYKPEGKVIGCPVVAPTDMGAECLQMMTPNYCPVQAECGVSPAPEIFPGQNDTPEQTGDVDAYIVPGEAASDNLTEETGPKPPQPEPYIPKKRNSTTASNEIDMSGTTSSGNLDSALGYVVYVLIILGIGTLGLLFMLFKNSLAEDEA